MCSSFATKLSRPTRLLFVGHPQRSIRSFSKSYQEKVQNFSSIKMSSEAQKTREWLVIIPDLPNSAEKRPHLGKQHVADMLPGRGTLWLLGGMMQDDTLPDGPKKVTGNVIIAEAQSREEVLAELAKDVYASGGVWDMDKVQIIPFESLFRKNLGF